MKPAFLLVLMFALLFLGELLTAVYLYLDRYGFSVQKINQYIHGNPEMFIQKKSFTGLLEIHLPHFIAVSVMFFVIYHFFYFFPVKKLYFIAAGITFVFIFLNFAIPFVILTNENVAFTKIFTFLIFIGASVFAFVLSALFTLRKIYQKC